MAADRRRGRRDNGIDAANWAAIDDLDPRIGEYLLDLLGAQGIGAYLQPSMDVNPVTRQAIVPARPTDRLYVDRSQADAARGYVRRILDEARQQDALDATFAGIVADFNRPVDPTAAPWPALEDVRDSPSEPAPPPPPAERPRPAGPVDARAVTEPSLLDGLDTFGAHLPDLPEEAPERFVPPPPPPLPRLSGQAIMGGLAIIGGLVLLLSPDLLPLGRGSAMLLGFAAILGGATALIMRLRPGTDPDDTTHPNDGARV